MLTVVALIGIAVYIEGWLQAWMPNLVAGTFTVAVTITVIERVLKREARAQLQPRLEDVLSRFEVGFQGLITGIAQDYGTHHIESFRTVSDDALALIDRWLNEHECEDNDDRIDGTAWFRLAGTDVSLPEPIVPLLVTKATSFAELLEQHRQRDREVMDEPMIRAIDEFVREVQGLDSLLLSLDTENFASNAAEVRQAVVEATQKFAAEFGRRKPEVLIVRPFARRFAASASALIKQQRAKRATTDD